MTQPQQPQVPSDPAMALTNEDTATQIAALSRLINAQARSIADLEDAYRGKQSIDRQRIEALQAEVQSLRRGLLAALGYLRTIVRTQRRIVARSTVHAKRTPWNPQSDESLSPVHQTQQR